MIQPNELRMGNFVYNEYKELYIINWINRVIENKANPIPLTEKWLIKFGFVKADNNRFEHELLVWDVEQHGDKFAFCIWDEENPAVTNFIMHSYFVHTFQNNFFALTGKELQQTNN